MQQNGEFLSSTVKLRALTISIARPTQGIARLFDLGSGRALQCAPALLRLTSRRGCVSAEAFGADGSLTLINAE
jgi:hypothetical protein